MKIAFGIRFQYLYNDGHLWVWYVYRLKFNNAERLVCLQRQNLRS